ncbi:hypothetical protein N7463_008778 [Penicillium fimorum]|uniref:Uncharacterized protein n=1 Tax=Penicillium fimorum TaxID=1882269 RepID=A0A9W9XPK2_9EURO|nr:hypothetical protein N7463_008778 [Penicillium fimorum]
MLSTTLITALILGLSHLTTSIALPSTSTPSTSFLINHVASDYFPNSKTDLSVFDVDVRYVDYSPVTESWLTTLNPH